ncbi:uncharacterized protein EV420DRAFT_1633586 [Desarmillaria tabescens]|uniref:Uncharacterized protein n=1 Tax=Armillaria tabescens TaxID=1929756 RepID=A0AA39NP06_ARMTA|nr:uncharacterized protein EV420DRAFT_1633586 [Desarmillaria tabescens]KAK0469158.1 hypothetical protein EV420DRAFT_1633586 [Desarmillaria tabescens]
MPMIPPAPLSQGLSFPPKDIQPYSTSFRATISTTKLLSLIILEPMTRSPFRKTSTTNSRTNTSETSVNSSSKHSHSQANLSTSIPGIPGEFRGPLQVLPNGRHHTASTSIPAILGDFRGLVRNDHRLHTRSSSSDLRSIIATSSHVGNNDILTSKGKVGSSHRKQKGKLSLSIPHIVSNFQAQERESGFPSSPDLSKGAPKHGFRIIGRGGSGSSHLVTAPWPKTRKSEPCLAQTRGTQLSPIAGPSRLPPLPVNTAASAPPQVKIRYSGRGGAGSKLRSILPKPHKEHNFGFDFKLPAKWKGKAKVEEEEEEEADSTAFIGDSESDVSSIHFAEPVLPLPKPTSPSRPPHDDDAFEEAIDEEQQSIPEVIREPVDVEEPDTVASSPIPSSSGLEMQQRKTTKLLGEDTRYPRTGFVLVPKNHNRVMSGRIVMPSLPPLLPMSSTMQKRSSHQHSLPIVMPDPKPASTLGTFEDPCTCDDDRCEAETTPVSSMIFSNSPSPASSFQDPIEEVPLHIEPEELDCALLSLRPDSPFVDSIAPVSPPTFERVISETGTFVSMVEKKQGWMGQWNRGNIGEVISALREL